MDLLRYFEAKAQNRITAGFFRQLDQDGRACELPGAIGRHYRYLRDSDLEYKEKESGWKEYRDKYPIKLLTCSNALQADLNTRNGDLRITGACHCGEAHYCAVCGTREARRVSSQLSYMFYRNKEKNYKYFMLTLTLPNSFDGFKTEFKVMDGVYLDLFHYLGYRRDVYDSTVLKGFFGAHELTYSDMHGWHPHIHFILAFDGDKVDVKKYSRTGNVKVIRIKDNVISLDDIVQHYMYCISDKFPDYFKKNVVGRKTLNIGFEPIRSIDDTCSEICKYFIDYKCFNSADTFYIYMRDIYKQRKYIKVGCFHWSDDMVSDWREFCNSDDLNKSQILRNSEEFFKYYDTDELTYFGQRKARIDGVLYSVPVFYRNDDIQAVTLSYNSKIDRYEVYTYVWSPITKDYVRGGKIKKFSYSKRIAEKLKAPPRESVQAYYTMIINGGVKSPYLIQDR